MDASERARAASRARPLGGMPTFLIIGAMKGGTTSLAMWLRAHPDVFIPAAKETHFFDTFYGEGLDWYRRFFAGAQRYAAVGEATPGYLFWEEAFHRMADALPDAKLIALLRNPIDRAYSQYWHRRQNGLESWGFAERVDLELSIDPDQGRRYGGYLARSRYPEQLDRVATRYPSESLLVLLFDDLRDDPETLFTSTCRFIGVDEHVRPPGLGVVYTRGKQKITRFDEGLDRLRTDRWVPRAAARRLRSRGRKPPQYPPMDPDVRARLVQYFAPFNEALGARIGRDLSAWDR